MEKIGRYRESFCAFPTALSKAIIALAMKYLPQFTHLSAIFGVN